MISAGRSAVIVESSAVQFLTANIGNGEMVNLSFKNGKGTLDLVTSNEASLGR